MIILTSTDGHSYTLDFGMYPDGTPYLKTTKELINMIGNVKVLTLKGIGSLEIHQLFSVLMALKSHDLRLSYAGGTAKMFIPMLPGGRQDKVLYEEGVDFLCTLASIKTMIGSYAASGLSIYIVDPHSKASIQGGWGSRTVGEIDQIKALGPDVINTLINNDYDLVIAPDAGAIGRAERMASALSIPLLVLQKHRDAGTGNITGYSPFDIGSSKALVVDDICDGGSTFVGLSRSGNREKTLDLLVTFGIFSKGTEILAPYYDNIYTTDLCFHQDDKGFIELTVMDRLIKEIANK